MIDVLVILDRSGSMHAAKADHEGGLRSFVDDQKKGDGVVRFTLVQFDDVNPCEILYDRTPMDAVGSITLTPRGNTPLLDAVGRSLAHLETQVPTPVSVVCLIVTDGQENASREWTRPRVKARIEALQQDGRYTFLYLGANVDAFTEARHLGLHVNTVMAFDNVGTAVANSYDAMSDTFTAYRASFMDSTGEGATPVAASAKASASLNFSRPQRSAARNTKTRVRTVSGLKPKKETT